MKFLEYKVVELSIVTDKDIEEAINSTVKDVRLRRRKFDGIQFVRLRRRILQRGLQWRFCFLPKAGREKGSGLISPLLY